MVGRAISPAEAMIFQILKTILCGGVKTPPYKPGKTVIFPANRAWGAPLPGGIYASPTNKGAAYTNPKTLPYNTVFWLRPRSVYA